MTVGHKQNATTGAPASSWKPYPAYKDSGVEWLGKVPEHWEVKMVKRLCIIKRGASPRPIDNPIYFDKDGEYSWVRISDVTASKKYLQSTDQKLSTLGKSKSVPLEPGELFLSIAGSVGKPIITAIKCCIHDGFVYFVGLKQNREYLFYLFSGGELYKGLGKVGTQLNLNTDTVGEMKIPVPPPPEQLGHLPLSRRSHPENRLPDREKTKDDRTAQRRSHRHYQSGSNKRSEPGCADEGFGY